MRICDTIKRGLVAAACTLALAGAQHSPMSPSQLATDLHDALMKLNLTAAAELAVNASNYLLPKLAMPYPQTILIPTDDAIKAAGARLQGLNGSTLGAILSYHIINGTLSYKKLPNQFDYHVVAMTQLNDSMYTNLPLNQTQALVVKRMDPKMGLDIVVQTDQDIFFESTTDGPELGSLLVQPIKGILQPPKNVTSTIEKIGNLSSLTQSLRGQQIGALLDSLRGVTVFAPLNIAFKDAASVLQAAQPNQIAAVLANHVLNGTVLYSPQMPRTPEENHPGTNKTTMVTTAGGQPIKLNWSAAEKCVQVTIPATNGQGNITANVLRTDTLTSNGVVHYIDKILLNMNTNTTAAGLVAGDDQSTNNIVKQEAPDLGTNSTKPHSNGAMASSPSADGIPIALMAALLSAIAMLI